MFRNYLAGLIVALAFFPRHSSERNLSQDPSSDFVRQRQQSGEVSKPISTVQTKEQARAASTIRAIVTGYCPCRLPTLLRFVGESREDFAGT